MLRDEFNRIRLVTAVLLSHYRHHPWQAVFLLLGLMLGVALWSAVELINNHARSSYDEANQFLGAEAEYWVRPNPAGGIGTILQRDYIELRRQGFTQLYPIIERRLRSADGTWLTLLATDFLALPISNATQNRASTPIVGNAIAYMTPPYLTSVPPELADELRLQEGDRLRLPDGRQLPPALFTSQPQQGRRLVVDMAAAFEVFEPEGFDYLGVTNLSEREREQLQQALPESLKLVRNQQSFDLTELTESLHIQLSAMGWLAFVVGLFIVFNAVRFALWIRTNTLVTLREMGVSLPSLSLGIIIETFCWALIGTVFGGGLGFVLGNALLPSVASSLGSLFGAIVTPQVTLSAAHWVKAGVISLLGVTLAIALPLLLSAKRSLRRQRLEPDNLSAQAKRLGWQAMAGLVLLAAGFVLLNRLNTVTEGFVVLAMLLFGATMLLSMALHLFFSWLQKSTPVSAWKLRWGFSDAFAQLPHLRIAMMALLLALVANIGVTTLVGSFRTALSDWLTVRLSADVYVQSATFRFDDYASAMGEELLAHHARIGVNGRWEDRVAEFRGLDANAPSMVDLPLASAQPGALQTWAMANFNEPVSILANEQVHHLVGTQLGEIIQLPTERGNVPFKVVGFFHDYGNPYYAFYLPAATLEQYWPSSETLGLALWLRDFTNMMDWEQPLLDSGALPGDWIDQQAVLTIALGIFDRTFAITGALNGLTLGVAAVALFTALMSLHQQRLTDYAGWRALGVSTSEWSRIVLLPLIFMTALTVFAALPLGLLLSSVLIRDINVVAFGWSMPLRWEWLPIVKLMCVAMLVVAVTSAFSLWRVKRQLSQATLRLGALS